MIFHVSTRFSFMGSRDVAAHLLKTGVSRMHFSKTLYIADSLIPKKDQLCREIKYGKGRPNAYAILRKQDGSLPEMIHCKYLKQKVFLESPMEIEGIAATYEEGLAYIAIQAIQKYIS